MTNTHLLALFKINLYLLRLSHEASEQKPSESDFRENEIRQGTGRSGTAGDKDPKGAGWFFLLGPWRASAEEGGHPGLRVNPSSLHIPSWCWCFAEVQQTAGPRTPRLIHKPTHAPNI